MKILVACANYPNNEGGKLLYYAHMRNLSYVKYGIEVTVLNFAANDNYQIDGISVITLKEYKRYNIQYDVLVCHAPNIRNHYKFLKKYISEFRKILMIFHGHEILKINEVYPKPYKYNKKAIVKMCIQNTYDRIKLKLWNRFIIENVTKLELIFVSNQLYKQFMKYVGVIPQSEDIKYHIIHNAVSPFFENNIYDSTSEKKFDFITIRSNIDSSTYCIDLINKMAFQNSKKSFLVIGKGEYFKIYDNAPNIVWINESMNHDRLIEYINSARIALMPTRNDSQGLMSCELATFGIPLITSDIEVCHEMFDKDFDVIYIDNDLEEFNLDAILNELPVVSTHDKNEKFFVANTLIKEIEILKSISIKE